MRWSTAINIHSSIYLNLTRSSNFNVGPYTWVSDCAALLDRYWTVVRRLSFWWARPRPYNHRYLLNVWCVYFVRKYVGSTLTENCFVKLATGWHLPQAWQRAEAKDVASEPKVQADGWWRHCSSDSHPLADGLQGIQMLDRSKSLLALSLFFLKKKCLCCWPFHMHRMVTESCFSHAVGIGIA